MAFDDTVPIKPLDPNYKPPKKEGPEAKKAEPPAQTQPAPKPPPAAKAESPVKPAPAPKAELTLAEDSLPGVDPSFVAKVEPTPKVAPALKAEPTPKVVPTPKVTSAPKIEVAPKVQPAPKAEAAARIEPTLKAEPAPKAEATGLKADTAAEAWLGLLAARGVDYLFANGGTDFAPVAEAYAKTEKLGWKLPRVVIVPHENLGVAMAHGYSMVTGRPQAMMVHVGVGTANALNGLINASRQNVPILFTAGRTPITEGHGAAGGSLLGARNNYIHWAQEHFDQGAMLREFVKWDYELRHAEQVETVLDRALAIAKSEPQGPVYVTLPREILASDSSRNVFSDKPTISAASPPAADPQALEEAVKLLAGAQH